MSTASPPAPTVYRWTRHKYHRLADAGVLGEDDRVELIEGDIVHMSPHDKPHAVAIRLVRRALRQVFTGERHLVDEQLPLALGPDSEPEPDVSVIEGQPRDFLDGHPTSAVLVVEGAEASLRFDRNRKRALYARHGLPEYWIVNLKERQLEVHREPSGEDYAEVTIYDSDQTVSVQGDSIVVSDLLP